MVLVGSTGAWCASITFQHSLLPSGALVLNGGGDCHRQTSLQPSVHSVPQGGQELSRRPVILQVEHLVSDLGLV